MLYPSGQSEGALAPLEVLVMVTRRKILDYWTETKQVVPDENGEPQVKQVTCCCIVPAGTRRACSDVAGNKTPCRCWCHSKKLK